MHSILKENHPPTVIDHALRCNFFNDNEVNMVTAGASKLSIYRLYDVEETSLKPETPFAKPSETKIKKKLEQVASFS